MDNYTAIVAGCQEGDSGDGLIGERFPWAEKRKKAMRLSDIYRYAGYDDYADRAGVCASWLQFYEMFDGSKSLHAANFCQLRLCPMCIARRARKAAYILSRVMDLAEHEGGVRYVFLTLTVRNCQGDKLRETLVALTKGWYRLMDQRSVARAVKGWFRAIEITRNREDGTYHPHIHAVLAVPKEYFDRKSGFYITHEGWMDKWRRAARLDYEPRVDVRITYDRRRCEDNAAGLSSTLEAAKYATKDKDFIDPGLSLEEASDIVTVYTESLRRRRLTAFGGVLRDAARKLKAPDLETDTDLVHVDDERIREDLADMITTYNWSMGVGDYVLASREFNPLKVVRVDRFTGEVVAADS